MSEPLPPLQQAKHALRMEMRVRRSTHPRDATAFGKLAALFLEKIVLPPHSIVSAYRPFREEMDPTPLTDLLRARGHKIALPVVEGKDQPLHFHLYRTDDELHPNAMGILQPAATAPITEPDVLLVPLLAFDRHRRRLGYGGGFYDRTLADLRRRKPIHAIGIAYSFQEIAAVPTGPHDVTLDNILTELNLF